MEETADFDESADNNVDTLNDDNLEDGNENRNGDNVHDKDSDNDVGGECHQRSSYIPPIPFVPRIIHRYINGI